MKILIIYIFISFIFSNEYYVSKTGNVNNSGTFD